MGQYEGLQEVKKNMVVPVDDLLVHRGLKRGAGHQQEILKRFGLLKGLRSGSWSVRG